MQIGHLFDNKPFAGPQPLRMVLKNSTPIVHNERGDCVSPPCYRLIRDKGNKIIFVKKVIKEQQIPVANYLISFAENITTKDPLRRLELPLGKIST